MPSPLDMCRSALFTTSVILLISGDLDGLRWLARGPSRRAAPGWLLDGLPGVAEEVQAGLVVGPLLGQRPGDCAVGLSTEQDADNEREEDGIGPRTRAAGDSGRGWVRPDLLVANTAGVSAKTKSASAVLEMAKGSVAVLSSSG